VLAGITSGVISLVGKDCLLSTAVAECGEEEHPVTKVKHTQPYVSDLNMML
jgi:hypothetical protein